MTTKRRVGQPCKYASLSLQALYKQTGVSIMTLRKYFNGGNVHAAIREKLERIVKPKT